MSGRLAIERIPKLAQYTASHSVTLSITVTDSTGAVADPSDVVVTVQSPDGTANAYSYSGSQVTRTGVGLYSLVVTLTLADVWNVRAQATGTINAAAFEELTCFDAFPTPPPPTTPGNLYAGQLARVAPNGAYSPLPGTNEGDEAKWNTTTKSWETRRGELVPDIDYNGGIDAASALVTLANKRAGAPLRLRDGIVYLGSTVQLPAGTTMGALTRGLRAGHRVFPQLFPVGLRFDIHHTGVAFDMTLQETSVQDVEIYYPGQQTNATPTFYDWTFNVAGIGSYVANVTCTNPYQFIKCVANGANFENIYSFPLQTGIYLGFCPDVVRVTNCHFNPIVNYQSGSTLLSYVQANASAYVVDGAQAFQFAKCLAFGYNVGLQFSDIDGDNQMISCGSWLGGSLDQCGACIRVDPSSGLCLSGLSMYGALLDTRVGGGNCVLFVDTRVPGSDVEKPGVWLTDCQGNAPGVTMQRLVWAASGSYGRCRVNGGTVLNVANEVFRNDSATAYVRGRDVGYQSGTSLTAGVGPMEIEGAYVV